jgi:receptor protein-tyrosine kinase
VRSPAALEKATRVGLLAAIPATKDADTLADAYRELRINLRFLHVADGPRVLVVTGADGSDGHTSVAVNLAQALAGAGHRTVLVDADLRHPVVTSSLGLPGSTGLSTVLAGEATLRDALQESSGLEVLPAGATAANPTDLIESTAAADLLEELSAQFDYVVVAAPSLPAADAALLASRSQGVLLVARYGRTTTKQLTEAVYRLERAGAPLLGTVLTMMPPKKR